MTRVMRAWMASLIKDFYEASLEIETLTTRQNEFDNP